MAVVPDGAPEGVVTEIHSQSEPNAAGHDEKRAQIDEKNMHGIDVASDRGAESDTDSAAKIYVPDDSEEFIDPRLKDYPVPLVAKTVALHNDFKFVPPCYTDLPPY